MADSKLNKVRVLTDTRHKGKVLPHNAVVEMTADEIKANAGSVDPHPDAVAYAEKLAAKARAAAAAAAGIEPDEGDE